MQTLSRVKCTCVGFVQQLFLGEEEDSSSVIILSAVGIIKLNEDVFLFFTLPLQRVIKEVSLLCQRLVRSWSLNIQ